MNIMKHHETSMNICPVHPSAHNPRKKTLMFDFNFRRCVCNESFKQQYQQWLPGPAMPHWLWTPRPNLWSPYAPRPRSGHKKTLMMQHLCQPVNPTKRRCQSKWDLSSWSDLPSWCDLSWFINLSSCQVFKLFQIRVWCLPSWVVHGRNFWTWNCQSVNSKDERSWIGSTTAIGRKSWKSRKINLVKVKLQQHQYQ